MFKSYTCVSISALSLALTTAAAQTTSPAAPDPKPVDQAAPAPVSPAAPTALSTPAITGPLQGIPPAVFDAGPFGKINVNGILNGYGIWQGNHVPGDNPTQAALGNAQVFTQKTDGWFQFYLQAGAYTIPALATPFLATDKTISNFYSPIVVAFVQLQVAKNTSIQIGALPTLIGASIPSASKT
jgi:hypothetical protein